MFPATLKVTPRQVSDNGPNVVELEGFFEDPPQSGKAFKFFFNSKPPGQTEERGYSMTCDVMATLTQAGKFIFYTKDATCELSIGHVKPKDATPSVRA